jgi:hypothetical protein
MTTAIRCILGLALATTLVTTASAQTAPTFKAESSGQIVFATPSKNIGCTFTPAGGTSVYKPFDGGPELSCDRIKPSYQRVVLTPKNVRLFKDVGDQDCCGETNIIAYGTRWTQGPFTCESAATGLTCRRSDGKGFTINQAAIKALP